MRSLAFWCPDFRLVQECSVQPKNWHLTWASRLSTQPLCLTVSADAFLWSPALRLMLSSDARSKLLISVLCLLMRLYRERWLTPCKTIARLRRSHRRSVNSGDMGMGALRQYERVPISLQGKLRSLLQWSVKFLYLNVLKLSVQDDSAGFRMDSVPADLHSAHDFA